MVAQQFTYLFVGGVTQLRGVTRHVVQLEESPDQGTNLDVLRVQTVPIQVVVAVTTPHLIVVLESPSDAVLGDLQKCLQERASIGGFQRQWGKVTSGRLEVHHESLPIKGRVLVDE